MWEVEDCLFQRVQLKLKEWQIWFFTVDELTSNLNASLCVFFSFVFCFVSFCENCTLWIGVWCFIIWLHCLLLSFNLWTIWSWFYRSSIKVKYINKWWCSRISTVLLLAPSLQKRKKWIFIWFLYVCLLEVICCCNPERFWVASIPFSLYRFNKITKTAMKNKVIEDKTI